MGDALEYILKRSVPASDGCLIWIRGRLRSGYGQGFHNGRKLRAHQIAWIAANGEFTPTQEQLMAAHRAGVLHRCGNNLCVEPTHLYFGTQVDNVADAQRHGTLSTAQCGTVSGYAGHKRRGESPCHDCIEARRAKEQTRRRPRVLVPCGTESAYVRHRRRGEPTCQACRDAYAKAQAQRRQRRAV